MHRNRLRHCGILFCVALFLFSGIMLYREYALRHQTAATFDSIADLIVPFPDATPSAPLSTITPGPSTETTLPPETSVPPTPLDQYGAIYAQNDDFAGWLSIDGTNINYPVMLTPDNPNYYLRRAFDETYSRYGVPYIQEDCIPGQSDNIIIYGHHMDDGSMFADLCKYEDQEFYKTHSQIRFDTLESFGEYEIIAVFKTVVYTDDGFPYYRFVSAQSETDFDAFIAQCKALALYDTGITAEYGDHLLTLSTCEYSRTNGRMVVVARQVSTLPGN